MQTMIINDGCRCNSKKKACHYVQKLSNLMMIMVLYQLMTLLLQSSKTYELTSCIHSNSMSIFLDEWFYYRNDLFITALLWMVLWQIKLQTRFSLKLLKVCNLLFLKSNRKMRNVNYYYKVFLYISLLYLLERR